MAEAAQTQVPTFKLVLVGDGGTGKVRENSLRLVLELISAVPRSEHHVAGVAGVKVDDMTLTLRPFIDHLRQAPLDWRV